MADYFKIQNHAVPVKHESGGFDSIVVGDNARAFSGKPLSTRRAIKKSWEFTTPLVTPAYARFLATLINGEGHTWDFDDSTDWKYSSKGLGPTADTVGNGTRYTVTTKFGAGALQVNASSYVQWNVDYDYDWTVMLWYGATFANHYIVRSNGAKWVDGVRNDAASTPFITVTGGNLRIGDSAAAGFQYFDDVVIFPELIDTSFAEDFGVMTTAFGSLPRLRVSGEALFNQVYSAEGFDVKVENSQGFYNGTWEAALCEVSFRLEESSRIS